MTKFLAKAALGLAFAAVAVSAANAGTLDDVKKKGFVQIGVSTDTKGFSWKDEKGVWAGLDVDYGRALAVAIFNDPNAVKFTPLSAKERFTALQSGEIDALIRNSTWTMSRDTSMGFTFVGVNYYDGQGFMVKKSLGVKSAKELNGASICVLTGTTTELNIADYFKTNKMTYKPVVFEKQEALDAAFIAGRCDVDTTDQSGLYGARVTYANPDDYVVLPEVISKEPLGPLVRGGDTQWMNVVKWVHYGLLTAEEDGLTKANVADIKAKTDNPEIKRILGLDGDFGKGIGLSNDWLFNIVSKLGNYGELFEANVGSGSALKIARGQNALWKNGGLQYAPPIR